MSSEVPNLKCANRHQILRNIKWFVKQLCSIFEETLQSKLYKGKMSPAALNLKIDSNCLPQNYKLSPAKQLTAIHKPNWCRSLTNSPIMRRFTPMRSSRGSTPVKKFTTSPSHVKCKDLQLSRLLLIYTQTEESERINQIQQFAQHVCVIYEYQIGMLKSVNFVMEVVKFVVDLIMKAIRMNFITELNSRQLNPTLFFLNIPLPKSGSKVVKTLQLGPGTEFSWRISDIFSRSGLRHNRVGGQDCSNLTISTHFYATSGSVSYSYRPDIYGYRNIIAIENSEYVSDQSEDTIKLYQLSKLDIDTLENPPDNDSLVGRDLEEQCMDHWHKCYKSMFFLICDRWEIIDHLENCDSFRVFCTREKICPVMQINMIPENFTYHQISALLQLFDVLAVSSDLNCATDRKNEDANLSGKRSQSDSNGDGFTDMETKSFLKKVYDNPAFVC